MRALLACLLLLTSCSWRPKNVHYREYYRHLENRPVSTIKDLPPKCVVFYVAARHLDYSNPNNFLLTLCKHPTDGSTNGDVGHAWVHLHSEDEDLIAGYSGESGANQPKFFDGVVLLASLGDENPAKYLWATQFDGFLQKGSGGHKPTFAAVKEISDEQYQNIRQLFFRPSSAWKEYRLIDHHCVHFVKEAASLVGLELDAKVDVKLPQNWVFGPLWSDPKYSVLTLDTPDALEKSLIEATGRGNLKALSVPFIMPASDLTLKRFQRICGVRKSKYSPS